MVKYFEELKRSMDMLAKEPNALFLGQAVEYDGTAMTTTLKDVPGEKKLEMPVTEELQMGASIGLAWEGFIPISIYPRWNFLLLATNQLVNHLDKLKFMRAKPAGVIIRVGVGSQVPLHPQHQHIGDYSDAFQYHMLETLAVYNCLEPHNIYPCYTRALERAKEGKSSIVAEFGDYYSTK